MHLFVHISKLPTKPTTRILGASFVSHRFIDSIMNGHFDHLFLGKFANTGSTFTRFDISKIVGLLINLNSYLPVCWLIHFMVNRINRSYAFICFVWGGSIHSVSSACATHNFLDYVQILFLTNEFRFMTILPNWSYTVVWILVLGIFANIHLSQYP